MKKILAPFVALAFLFGAGAALAQSSPNLITGQVPTAAQWNSYFQKKQDVLNFVPLNIAGGVMTGKLTTVPSATGNSGLNIAPGVAPFTPNNGDVWTTAVGIFARINGVTVGPLSGPSGASFTATSPLAVTFPGGATNYALNFNSTLTGAGGNLGINLATSNAWSAPQSIAGLTVTSSFTATGLVGLPALASQAANTIVAAATAGSPVAMAAPSCVGPALALQWLSGTGLQCGTITASASAVTVGTTDVLSGTPNGLLFNSATKLGNLATANNGVLVTSGTGVPSISTTLPNGLALGTPLSATLTNATGLPIATGVSGLGTGVSAFLAAPSSANLITAMTDETGTGPLVFGTAPSISAPVLSGTITGTYTLGGTPSISGGSINSGLVLGTYGGTGVNNGARTITVGGNFSSSSTVSITGALSTAGAFTQAGAFATTLTSTATTNSTLPAGTHTLAGLDVAQQWNAVQQFISGGFQVLGSTSGGLTINCAAICGTSTITFPSGTTNFAATGGTGQFVKQATAGAPLTVSVPLFSEISGTVALNQIAPIGANRLLANNTGSTASPVDVTGANARLPALLNIDQMTTVGDANLTIAATTRTVGTTTTLTAVRTFTLPLASSVNPGQSLTIVDQAGAVNGSNTITVARAGGDTINGTTVAPITTQFGGLVALSDGVSKWTTLATGGGGGGGGISLVNTTPGQGLTGGPITTSGTLNVDTTVFPGFKSGLTLSTAGSSTTFGIATGSATDSGNVAFMQLASAYTKTTGAWALGTAAGSLDTGTVAINTWYHVFIMRRPDTGATDICTSTTLAGCITGSNIPTAYTQFRRIGSMLTNGSSQWVQFTQNGNQFTWVTPFQDVPGTAISTTNLSPSLTVPPGISVKALLDVVQQGSAGQFMLVYSGLETVQAANSPLGNFNISLQASGVSAIYAELSTDTAKRVQAVASGASTYYISTRGWTDNFGGPAGAGAGATAPSANVLQNYISGYTLSTAGSSTTYSLSTGSATDNLNAGFIVLANAISKTTGSWAVGNAAGGLDSGTIANSTWYHAFVIQRPDTGVVDSCVTTNVAGCSTATNIPSAYTMQRRVGSMKTNGSGQWTKFLQIGNDFQWDNPVTDVNNFNGSTVPQAVQLTVPPGVPIKANMSAGLIAGSANVARAFFYTPGLNSAGATGGTLNAIQVGIVSVSGQQGWSQLSVITDTARQILFTMDVTTSSLFINTFGWTDTRNGPNITGGNAGVANIGGASGVVGLDPSLTQSGNSIGCTTSTGSVSGCQKLGALTAATPASVSSISSTTGVMMGLGSSCAITPRSTGRVRIEITGTQSNNTANQFTSVNLKYGTGAAPAVGTAQAGVGTPAGAGLAQYSPGTGFPVAFALVATLPSMTIGTPYWYDINFAVQSSSGGISSLYCTAYEL